MSKFYTRYNLPPTKPLELDIETKFVSQAEADMVGLSYQLKRFGFDGLAAKFEAMKGKFGYADTRLVPDFQTMANNVAKGVEYFNKLPVEIRQKFDYKADKYYEYLGEKPEEALKQGYIDSESKAYLDSLYPPKQELNKTLQPTTTEVVTPTVEPVEIPVAEKVTE